MRDFTNDIRDIQRRVNEAEAYLSIVDNRERLAVLEAEVADPELWNDQNRARQLNAEYANLKDDLDTFDSLSARTADVEVLHELARDEHPHRRVVPGAFHRIDGRIAGRIPDVDQGCFASRQGQR